MKYWVKITLWSVFGGAVIFLLFYTQSHLRKLTVKETSIHIDVEGENSFLTEEELKSRLQRNNLIFVNQKAEQVNLEKIEQFIQNMEEVKNVKVFLTWDASLEIDVKLRRPIAHVFNLHGENFFLDADGYKISGGTAHTARVLVVTGEIPDRYSSESVNEIINNDSLKTILKLDDVYRISNYVCNDPLMQSLIGQIHRKNNGDFVLVPLVGDQTVVFGTAHSDKEVEGKFEKLKIFYKEAMPYEGWNKYREISLKYDKQIVCKKKV